MITIITLIQLHRKVRKNSRHIQKIAKKSQNSAVIKKICIKKIKKIELNVSISAMIIAQQYSSRDVDSITLAIYGLSEERVVIKLCHDYL